MEARKARLSGLKYAIAALFLLLAVALLVRIPSATAPQTQAMAKDSAAQPNAVAGAAIQSKVDYSQSKVIAGAKVIQEVKHDVSPPLRSIPPAAPQIRQEAPENPVVSQGPSNYVEDPTIQRSFGKIAIPTPIINLEGINQATSTCGCLPPDTQGDVGPNHYIQWVNTAFKIWDKNGNVLQPTTPGNTLWSGFGGACQAQNAGDPITLYDPMADRWLMSQFTVSAPYQQCVAVSTSPDPLGTWNRYAFTVSPTALGDYPKLGVWPDAYYLTTRMFEGGATFTGSNIYALDRAAMLAGQPASMQMVEAGSYFDALLPADMDGHTQPPAGSPNYLVNTGSSNTIHFWKFHVDWVNPSNTTLTGPANIITTPWNSLCAGNQNCIPQPGTAQRLDALDFHPMHRLAYRNFGTYEALVTNETVNAGTNTTRYAGVRWWEIRDPNGVPTVYQEGTYAPDTNNRWMGSIAQDQNGNMALGYSVSSSTVYPSVRYTGRLVTDTLGLMTLGEASIIEGTGSQTSTSHRWGDYSAMSVDPTDDCTFWYTQEYYQTTSSAGWQTRIGSFRFPSCGNPVPTATGTPPTATATATRTPTACAPYTYTTATATIEPGVDDTGNHCDDCSTFITLPFPIRLYGQSFSNAFVDSDGTFQLRTSTSSYLNGCLPVPIFEYSFVLYWTDLVTDRTGTGVFTSVTGNAPNRTYNVEWRACIYAASGCASPTNFELRYHEDTGNFEYVYGVVSQNGANETIGLQRDSGHATQFACNTAGSIPNGLEIRWVAPACYQTTPTATPTATGTPCTLTFSDVNPGDYFYEAVMYLACHGVISGYSDGTFRPYNDTTRGQLSKIIVLARGWPIVTPTGTPTFQDVPADNPFYGYIETAYAHQIISGYSCGTGCLEFRWANNITRGQLTKVVVLAMNWAITPPSTPTFIDVPLDHPFFGYIETAYAHQIISGYSCGTNCLEFRPYNNATRGQIAKIVYQAIQNP